MTNSGHHFNLHLHTTSSGNQRNGHHRHESNSSSGSSSPDMMTSKGHKHYQSHAHVDTPHPMLEPTSSKDSIESTGSTGSYMDVHRHNQNGVQRLTESMPNPFTMTSHTIQDHITELHYGHISREAKREANRLSAHSGNSHSWNHPVSHTRSDSIPEYVEEVENWKERDAELWAKEMQKREKARRWTGDAQKTEDSPERT